LVKIGGFSFGVIEVDGVTHDRDVVIDGDRVRQRSKKPSKEFRERYGHTPLSIKEAIPWNCRRMVIGTGAYGSLPVMPEVVEEARRRGVDLALMPTAEAVRELKKRDRHTNAILHITC
jgi:hypothetical protein